MCPGTYRGQKWVPDSLELELQTVVNLPVRVPGIQLGSPTRAVTLNHRAVSAARYFIFADWGQNPQLCEL